MSGWAVAGWLVLASCAGLVAATIAIVVDAGWARRRSRRRR